MAVSTGHFASKGDLYAEVLDCFFTNPDWDCGWDGADVDPANGLLGPQIVRTYLCRAHLEEIENACPMVALPSDVARAGVNARKAYQTAFEAMVEILQQGSQNDVLPNRKSALAIAALCIGGMVIARASDDPALGDELREAVMTIALQLGGLAERPGSCRPADDTSAWPLNAAIFWQQARAACWQPQRPGIPPRNRCWNARLAVFARTRRAEISHEGHVTSALTGLIISVRLPSPWGASARG